jgi:hypothetical protein
MANLPDSSIFPHPTLTQLSDTTPTQVSLKLLHQELNANAISIPSNRGNGVLGHLALVTPPAKYLQLAGVPFVPPIHPGNAPIHVPGATGPQITETNRQYSADLKEFTLFFTTEAALKKQLLQAVPSTFTQRLRDDELGYANATTLALLTHLDETYGAINEDDLDRNMAKLHKPWQVSRPIEELFHQLNTCRAFAALTDPISEATAVRAGLQNLENTAAFTEAIREWRQLPLQNRTLANFEQHFAKADVERKRTLTTRTAGYHQAAASIQTNTTANTEHTSNAVISDNKHSPQYYYCWSHGLSTSKDHTSQTCRRPAPNHRKDATLNNMMGGCNLIQRKRGEKPVYVRPPRTTTPTPPSTDN